MPYLRLLERLLTSAPGAQAALLMDGQGEVVVEAGARDDRHRLIGAYQGIALGVAQRTIERYAAGPIQYIVCRYAWGAVILRPLRDGYCLVVSLAPGARVAECVHHSAEAQDRLDAEL